MQHKNMYPTGLHYNSNQYQVKIRKYHFHNMDPSNALYKQKTKNTLIFLETTEKTKS